MEESKLLLAIEALKRGDDEGIATIELEACDGR